MDGDRSSLDIAVPIGDAERIAPRRRPNEAHVQAECPQCHHVADVPYGADHWVCSGCRARWVFCRCLACGLVSEVKAGAKGWTCGACGASKPAHASAEELAANLAEQHEDPDHRVIPGCTFLGGYGHELRARVRCNIECSRQDLAVVPQIGPRIVIPYRELVEIAVGGPGLVSSGGGFVGGGFGIDGAAQGIAIASVLNAITTKTEVHTVIRLTALNSELFFHWGGAPPEELRIRLSPAIGRVESFRRAASKSSPPSRDPLERLKELGALRDSGVLSAEEFDEAKRRVLKDFA